MEELLFLDGLAAEILFKQSDTWCDFVRNFTVSIVVLADSFYCILISSYISLYQPMYLRPIYWTLVLEGLDYVLYSMYRHICVRLCVGLVTVL